MAAKFFAFSFFASPPSTQDLDPSQSSVRPEHRGGRTNCCLSPNGRMGIGFIRSPQLIPLTPPFRKLAPCLDEQGQQDRILSLLQGKVTGLSRDPTQLGVVCNGNDGRFRRLQLDWFCVAHGA